MSKQLWPKILLFCLVSGHYFLWVQAVKPLPQLDALAISYYPTLNYLRTSLSIGNDYSFLTAEFFGQHYPCGPALIAWLFAFLELAPAVLALPEILNTMVLLPFLLATCFLRRPKALYFLSGLSLCFFPFTQLCIKQFSPHGLNVAYAFLAVLIFRQYLISKEKNKQNLWLILFAGSFAFAAIAKHLGLIFFLNFIITWLTWSILCHKYDLKVFAALILIGFFTLPFYNFSYQAEYFLTSIRHNPDTNIIHFIFMAGGLLLVLPFFAFVLRHTSHKKPLPHFFRYGILLFLASLILCLMILFEQQRPLLSFALGYSIIILAMFLYNLSSRRGFFYLHIAVNTAHLCMLFGTGAGSVPYVIFFPLLLMLVQTISETSSRKFSMIMATCILLISNFFPDIDTLERHFGYIGRRIYLGIFQSPHHNPFGWKNYCFGDLKKEIINQWSELNFPAPPHFIVENFGPYTSAQLVFFRNVLYSFPPTKLLEYDENYKTLYFAYRENGAQCFAKLIEEMKVPVLLYTQSMLPEEEEFWPPPLDELINKEHFSIDTTLDDTLVYALNTALVEWAEGSGFLQKYYDCRHLPAIKPLVLSCTDKRLSQKENKINYGLETLNHVLEKYKKLLE